MLSYATLCGKLCESPTTLPSTPLGHEGTTPREDQETHIAFGTKIAIPAHLRRNSLKENRESGKLVHSQVSSSKMKHGQSGPDVRYTNSDLIKSPLYPKEIVDKQDGSSDPKGIEVNQAPIQPRPPKASSAGKVRRPIRLKSSNSGGKAKTPDNVAIEKHCNSVVTERQSGSVVQDTLTGKGLQDLGDKKEKTSFRTSIETRNGAMQDERVNQERSNIIHEFETVKASDMNVGNVDEKFTDGVAITQNLARPSFESDAEKRHDQMLENGKEDNPISLNEKNSEMSLRNLHRLANEQDDSGEMNEETKISMKKKEQMDINNSSYADDDSQVFNSDLKFINENKSSNAHGVDTNNNDSLSENDDKKPAIRPRKLPLASNNPVFTFASMPRSPRSGRRKFMDSPMVNDVITPSAEAAPEVLVSLAEELMSDEPSVKNGQSKRNRGASLEDDFCKLSGKDMYMYAVNLSIYFDSF